VGLNAQVLGISVDHVPGLKAWAESLGGINYPLLSDFWPHGAMANLYGVLRSEGYTERAIFIIDKQGIIRYIDIHDIDKQPSNDELRSVLKRIDPEAAARYEADLARAPKAAPFVPPKGGIVMYCTSWCPGCRRARLWFQANHLEFTEIDINAIPGAAEQVMKWNNGNRTTPTFDIDGVIFSNFDEDKLAEALRDQLKKK
jgi:peroxiredoxin